MSSVVSLTEESDDGTGARDPFGDERIELEEEKLRAASPAGWLSGVVARLDEAATRFVYGSR